ncbi:MAG: hypothetical protein P1U32_00605 [Legionellaceae bacterium]|nr:hypothetical protein [Legionellaceae bacterium]
MRQIIYIQGKVNRQSYESLCNTNNAHPCVFIFPGNKSHHTKNTTLYSIKSGGGLAHAANELGHAKYPVLSLPTTSLEQWGTSEADQQVADGAIADLYRALGAGYSLMLPVRNHENTTYFDEGLANAPHLEPSFWGGIQTASNQPLARHYMQALNNLHVFIARLNAEGEETALQTLGAVSPELRAAYEDGAANDAWVAVPGTLHHSQTGKALSPASKTPAAAHNPHIKDAHDKVSEKTTTATLIANFKAATNDLAEMTATQDKDFEAVNELCKKITQALDKNKSDTDALSKQLDELLNNMKLTNLYKPWAECKKASEMAGYIMHTLESGIRWFLEYLYICSSTPEARVTRENYFFKGPKKAAFESFNETLTKLEEVQTDLKNHTAQP